MKARVYVTLKPSVFDPQGRVVADALVTLGYQDVKDVRQGKFFELEVADTDPATLTMDPASIESRITDRTRAIMPVHICGIPCDMDPINAIAKKHKLPDQLIDFIRTHHGTTRVQYFYKSFLKNFPDEVVDEQKFSWFLLRWS